MNNVIEDKLKKTRIKLFKTEEELIYFGILAYRFNFNIYDFDHDEDIAFVEFQTDSGLLCENKINFNSRFIGRPDYTIDNFANTIVHEILHILEKHGIRRKGRTPEYWSLAVEHCVARTLKSIKNITPYKNHYFLIPELHISKPHCSAEEAYEWIMQNVNMFNIIPSNTSPSLFSVENVNSGDKFELSTNIGGSNDESGNPLELASINDFVSQASAVFEILKNQQKSKGLGSSNLIEYLNNILKIEIPWTDVLEKSIKRNIISKVQKRKWKSPNKKFGAIGITLPGKQKSIGTKEEHGIAYVCVDTSGSVDLTELKKFAYIMLKSISYFEEIRILIHDTTIKESKTFTKKDIYALEDFITNKGFKGRGGTSHKYVFDEIEKQWNDDNHIKNMLSMVILLTDGYSDIENKCNKYSWIRNNVPITIILPPNSYKFKTLPENFTIININ